MTADAGLDDLRWLLDFAAVDLRPLTAARLSSLKTQARRFAIRRSPPASTHHFKGLWWPWEEGSPRGGTYVPAKAVRAVLTKLQGKLRTALTMLDRGQPWTPPHATPFYQVVNAGLRKTLVANGTHETIILAAVGDLLFAHWSAIRRCKTPSCRRPFVPTHHKRQHHAAQCHHRTGGRRSRRRACGTTKPSTGSVTGSARR